jgi:hypothetical protein
VGGGDDDGGGTGGPQGLDVDALAVDRHRDLVDAGDVEQPAGADVAGILDGEAAGFE